MESDTAEKPPAETPPDQLFIDPKNSYYNEGLARRTGRFPRLLGGLLNFCERAA
jgi:hypothetical protein